MAGSPSLPQRAPPPRVATVRLKRLYVRNFRAFREAEVDFEPATVLIGANDSGNSALLDAINWIFSTADRTGATYSCQSTTNSGDGWAQRGEGK